MRNIAILLTVMCLPVLLAGLDFSFKTTVDNAMRAYLHPQQKDDAGSNVISIPPSGSGSRPPFWRLDAMMTSEAAGTPGNLLPQRKNIYYYNSQSPTRIDSIWVMEWNTGSSVWIYLYTRYLSYEPTGEYITQQSFRHFAASYDFIQQLCYYDAQNRLTDFYMNMYDQVEQDYNLTQRMNFTYSNNALVQSLEIYPGNGRAYYKKYIIDNDAQGRMESILTVAGPDSVNWGNLSQEEISYTAEDTSTGAEYISYLSRYLLTDDDWGDGYYGKMDFRDHFESWNGIGWIDHERYTYFYNPGGLCSEIVRQVMETTFVNVSKYAYVYDTSQNLFSRDYMEWNPDTPGWLGSTEQLSYFWTEITANQDDTIPLPEIGLIVYPNPFSQAVNIGFNDKRDTPIHAGIYNLKGQCLKQVEAYNGNAVWDGKDTQGREASNGVYVIKAELNSKTLSSKLIRVK